MWRASTGEGERNVMWGVIGRVKMAPKKGKGSGNNGRLVTYRGINQRRVMILTDYHALNKKEPMSP